MKNISANLDGTLKPSVPQVSWLLCAHVSNVYLKLAIESCLEQSFKDFEIIFVANGPEAALVAQSVFEWFGSDARVRIFMTPVKHLSFSLSLGLHHARGHLIARMDSDDISYAKRLEYQVQYMTEHPDIAVLGTNYDVIDTDGCIQRQISLPESDMSIRRALLRGNPFCHPSVMFRRQIVLDAGGYLGGLHAEDYDLWARLSLNSNYQFSNLKEICIGYRVVGVGIARRSRWAYASIAATQFRNFLVGAGGRWLLASIISCMKLIVRSSPIQEFN